MPSTHEQKIAIVQTSAGEIITPVWSPIGSGGLSEAQVDARVNVGITQWIGAAPGALDTLAEIAAALGDDQTALDGLTSAVAGKQPLAAVLTNTTASFTSAQETKLGGIATAATANAADSALRDRSTHTGTQTLATISDAGTAATHGHAEYATAAQGTDARTPVAHNHSWSTITSAPTTLAGYGISDAAAASHTHAGLYQPLATVLTNTTASFTAAQETKLSAIASGATANSADAALLTRANHSGTQTAATISDFATAADARVAAASIVSLVVPATGATQTFTTAKANQLIACNHVATIAAQTFVFPTDANSAIGQELSIFSRNIITIVTLTLNSNTILGLALTTLPLNGNVAWRKVGTSTWARIQ